MNCENRLDQLQRTYEDKLDRMQKHYEDRLDAALAASQRPEQAGAGAFSANDLAILHRLIDQYTEEAYLHLPKDDPSHAIRLNLRKKVTQYLIAAKEAEWAALAQTAEGETRSDV